MLNMADGQANNQRRNERLRRSRLPSDEIRNVLGESDSEGELYHVSDEDEYFPEPAAIEFEESDVEIEPVIEYGEDFDSDESSEDESIHIEPRVGKDGTQWYDTPYPQAQTISRNILRQKPGPLNSTALFTAKEIFKSIMSKEICDIILRETKRKGQQVTEDYNRELIEKFPVSSRPLTKKFIPFTEEEFDAFLGILLVSGVHRSNKEHVSEMWKLDSLPLIRAAMSRDRFKMLLRFIRFDNVNTRNIRITTDKAAPIRDIWTMLNQNLHKNYKPTENITVDEQLFPYRGHTKFTQYIPSKPAKYGIKVFWACDAANAYPLHGKIYTGKPQDGKRQVNIGERTVLDLVAMYKGSGRNVTTDNFFTSMQLATTLNSWNMTLVGTVRKNKRFLPPKMLPSKARALHSTNFVFKKDITLCSYVPKINKSVILLSTMHMTADIMQAATAKPEIIKYYNQTKGGVDTMDKMLTEYTVKRRTNRWPLAFFFNMIDIAALAAYIIYMEHNQRFNTTDRHRKFLKELANQLCMPAIEIRTSIPKVVGNRYTRNSMEMVLGRPIQQIIAIPKNEPPRDASGRIQIVGSCLVCRELGYKQRKTRKACSTCSKPICNEHSINKSFCETCNQQNT
ncbi:piggyBac transposable element-derived protein 4-like [Daktulosphaira vitifoliae]|uniref:piggyBac transposable element-derived protein 4-like n=1 Tax=Daktulosphaira vitifoliae TaxID=58002 RepID=UPI0021A9F2C0|nr:piggyBac transposable element-derived protein 4-like [Daktulosphaira vitifoliae]